MTARAGDAVLLSGKKDIEPKRYFTESVILFGVFPVEFNELVVETGQSWLDGKNQLRSIFLSCSPVMACLGCSSSRSSSDF